MEKQRQFQVLLLRHSRIKPTSSLNQMSVVRPASSGIHPTVNEKLKEVLTGVHHGRHFSHSLRISGYRFFLIPNQLNHIIFGVCFVQLPHYLIGRIWKRSQSIATRRMDVDDLHYFVTLYRDRCEVHYNQTKND